HWVQNFPLGPSDPPPRHAGSVFLRIYVSYICYALLIIRSRTDSGRQLPTWFGHGACCRVSSVLTSRPAAITRIKRGQRQSAQPQRRGVWHEGAGELHRQRSEPTEPGGCGKTCWRKEVWLTS